MTWYPQRAEIDARPQMRLDVPSDATSAAPRRTIFRRFVIDKQRALEILVMGTLAAAQPLFSLFGSNGTFLLAHRLEGASLIWYAVALIAVPFVALLVVDVLGSLFGERAGEIAHATVLGILLGLALAPPLNRAMHWDGLVSIIMIVFLSTLGVALFLFVDGARRVVRFAWFAPLVFLFFFLFASPASILLEVDDPKAYAASTASEVSVIWLVFDQFPLALIVDDDGQIIEERFPGFARLASTSIWFPEATTVSGATSTAVPAALTGRVPEPYEVPVVMEYPVNVFTLLAGSHTVRAQEEVTRLCPLSVCDDYALTAESSLTGDTLTVLVRSLLAEEVADRLVPAVNDRWAAFGGDPNAITPDPTARVLGDDRYRFETFLDDLGSVPGPGLHYLHIEKPHEPLFFLPDGRKYDYCSCYGVDADGRWPDDSQMMDQRLQAYLMQAMYADRELARMLDRLEETSLLDPAMVIVMSDHGASLMPGTYNRQLHPETYPDLLPIPLFVKLPGQTTGVVDDRDAQLVDILPTILEVVDVDPAQYALDGTSILRSPPADDMKFIVTEDGIEPLDLRVSVTDSPLIEHIQTLFPDPADPFEFGPNSKLVGMRAEELVVDESRLTANVATMARLSNVDLTGDYVPAHVIGELSGADVPTALAVSFNGTVAGVGSTYRDEVWRIAIIADPQYLHDGANELELYEVSGSGLRLVAID